MSKHTGTAKGVSVWLRNLKIDEVESVFELAALSMEGPQTVASWSGREVVADPPEWSARVDQLATEDANGRGQTTRYELRHSRAERVIGVTHLRRVVAAEKEGAEAFDGSSQSVIKQMAASMERAHSQVIEAARAAIDGQRASMALLQQAYTLIGGLQASNIELHAQQLETQPPPKKDETMRQLIEVFGPVLVNKLLTEMTPSGPSGPAS